MNSNYSPVSVVVESFSQWRECARSLIARSLHPRDVLWVDHYCNTHRDQGLLLETTGHSLATTPQGTSSQRRFSVPKSFLDLAKTVAQHRSAERWELLYRILYRIVHEQRSLLSVASDPDVHRVQQMEKNVRRDAHKAKAFVRFRKVTDGNQEWYVAWHRPDHYVLPLVADFFARRFSVMQWVIFTPDESVAWNGQELTFAAGCPRSATPRDDEMDALWRTYYAAIFNPARIKVKAMQAEMPKKHWATLPEATLIDDLLRNARQRTNKMVFDEPDDFSTD